MYDRNILVHIYRRGDDAQEVIKEDVEQHEEPAHCVGQILRDVWEKLRSKWKSLQDGQPDARTSSPNGAMAGSSAVK